MDTRDESANNNGIDNIFLDDATNRMRINTIIEQIFETVLSDWFIDNRVGNLDIVSRYIATGPISDIIGKFLARSNDTFYTTARKVFIMEDVGDEETDYNFTNGNGVEVIDDGSSDTTTVNDVEVVGDARLNHYEETFNGDNSTTVFSLSNSSPIIVTVEHPVGTVLDPDVDYEVDFENSQIVFTSAPASGTDNIKVKYESEDVGELYFRSSDSTSINNIGRYSARIYFPGMKDFTFLPNFANGYITAHKDILQRIRVKAPSHINYIRHNQKVEVVNSVKGINHVSGGDGLITVKSLRFTYPMFVTEIDVGEYMLDTFDTQRRVVERLNELDTEAIKTKHK